MMVNAIRKGVSMSKKNAPKKTNQRYKDQVTQDNQLFLSIKVQGQSIETNQLILNGKNRRKQQRQARSLSIKKQSKLLQFRVKRQLPLSMSKWTLGARQQNRQNKPKSLSRRYRSRTLQSQQSSKNKQYIIQQSAASLEEDFKTKTSYPKLSYKQIRLDQQLVCNFKQAVDEFNRTKQELTQKIQQNHNKINQKMFRKTFANPNPNFYQYQQYMRQNYHAKHLKGTLHSFNINNNNDKNHQTFQQTNLSKRCVTEISNNKKQVNKNLSQVNRNKLVYVYEDKKPQQSKQMQKERDEKDHFLQIKRHQFSQTQRISTQRAGQEKQKPKLIKFTRMNKTSNYFDYNCDIKQQDKIQPWPTSNEQNHFYY